MPRNTHTVAGLVLSLEDGQEWDDEVTLTMNREQAHVILAALSTTMREVMEGLEEAKSSADRGDLMGVLIGPHLAQSGLQLQEVMQSIASQILPALWAEIQETDAAKAAAERKN